ncbi:UNVERIFIED_CONTAM: Pentatricopeptide repeat-containing protein, chloroplastic/mitochondrial [Sesamum latifolium]|uniref:Pentatricopeptide repeat-containing protein, chloroplastic/mitochondrial n=1 Tax=Sesamum latifolium TaxID=2727402 RepID=A0AAW2UYK9_9LAMI
MPERSLVSWNVIIDALDADGEFDEALRMFVEMKSSFDPDGYTVQSVIDACAGLGALSMGMWAHAYVLRKWEIDANFDVLVKNSLIEMYCKCGSLRMARQVFQGMSRRDVNSWNAMILGFAMHGEAERVFEHFGRMMEPVLQHFGCLVDLLARNGQILEALDIVSSMPMKPDADLEKPS